MVVPVDCLSLTNEPTDRVNYDLNYQLTMQPGDSCIFNSTATSYVEWDSYWSPFVTVTRTYFSPPIDQFQSAPENRTQPCVLAYSDLPYTSDDVMYTENSEWPNAD